MLFWTAGFQPAHEHDAGWKPAVQKTSLERRLARYIAVEVARELFDRQGAHLRNPRDLAVGIDVEADSTVPDLRRLVDDDAMVPEVRVQLVLHVVEDVGMDEQADVAADAGVAVERLDFLATLGDEDVGIIADPGVADLAEPLGDLALAGPCRDVVIDRRHVEDRVIGVAQACQRHPIDAGDLVLGRLIDAARHARLDLERADAGLAGGEEIDHVLDVELRLVVEHAIEEGRGTAQARRPLVLLDGILYALAQAGDELGWIDAGKWAALGQRRKPVDQRQGIGLAHITREHGHLLLGWLPQGETRARRMT